MSRDPVDRGWGRRRLKSAAAPLVFLVGLVAVIALSVYAARDSPASQAEPPSTASATSAVTTSTTTISTVASSATTEKVTTTTIYTHPVVDPVRVVIPAIDVDATLIRVGLTEDGAMEMPPFGLAAWYELGPLPGAGGPAVIVAHVDTTKGPDVFFRLPDLAAGDEILVYGSGGDVATFAVDSLEQQLKTALPAERIWNDTWEPLIRLITCAGEFDYETRHYLSNVIVYGHLVR